MATTTVCKDFDDYLLLLGMCLASLKDEEVQHLFVEGRQIDKALSLLLDLADRIQDSQGEQDAVSVLREQAEVFVGIFAEISGRDGFASAYKSVLPAFCSLFFTDKTDEYWFASRGTTSSITHGR